MSRLEPTEMPVLDRSAGGTSSRRVALLLATVTAAFTALLFVRQIAPRAETAEPAEQKAVGNLPPDAESTWVVSSLTVGGRT